MSFYEYTSTMTDEEYNAWLDGRWSFIANLPRYMPAAA